MVLGVETRNKCLYVVSYELEAFESLYGVNSQMFLVTKKLTKNIYIYKWVQILFPNNKRFSEMMGRLSEKLTASTCILFNRLKSIYTYINHNKTQIHQNFVNAAG